MKIQVQIRSIYGKDNIYPVCDKARLLAKLAGKITLTASSIQIIKQLGFQIEIIPQEVKI